MLSRIPCGCPFCKSCVCGVCLCVCVVFVFFELRVDILHICMSVSLSVGSVCRE
jgi:hypothetical protein